MKIGPQWSAVGVAGAGARAVIGCRRPMMDLLIDVCAIGRLNPATHALVVPADGTVPASANGTVPTTHGAGTVPFTPSQSLQSLGVGTVRVVAKPPTTKHGTTSAQPFEVRDINILIIIHAVASCALKSIFHKSPSFPLSLGFGLVGYTGGVS